MESYDFSGKTSIPFATSGCSGMGKTDEGLEKSCPGAKMMTGKVLNGVFKYGNKNMGRKRIVKKGE